MPYGPAAVTSPPPGVHQIEPTPPLHDAEVPPSRAGPWVESPFGATLGVGRRAIRWGLYLGVPLAAIAVAFFLTRPGEEASTAAGHIHGAAVTADSARAVMLSPDAERRIGVTYTTATMGPLSQEVRTVGQVTFDETRVKSIAAKIDGYVERLYVDYTGMPVRVGDPLLEIYSPMLVAAQEELLLAKQLAIDVVGGTPDATNGAAELLRSARRRLAYWDIPVSVIAAIEQSGEVQRTLTLHASAGGVVLAKLVLSGQKIMAGDPLYRIADLSVVWVEGEVFEQDLALVRVGLPIVAEFEALPGEQIRGRIAFVYPTLNPVTRTVRVRAEVSNPGLRLKPGMYATFHFTGGSRGNVLSVPRSAVLTTGERNLVFVRRTDGQLEPREIRVGVSTQDRIEVLSGVAAGETVVASATFLVDAESNLGSALGGMGNMPGMDITAPKAASQSPARSSTTPAPKDSVRKLPDDMPNMPGMKKPTPPR
ncbi:MAG: efflux RND transporter periplasmic adaptor subunit [Gemmatimonadaceae bacterium]